MPVRWRYGDAGDRWPVRPGEVWRAGPHTLACMDLETDEARDYWRASPVAACMYVDPPWSTGNAKAFRTKAGVSSESTTVERLWAVIMGAVASRVVGDVYAEIGTRHRDDAVRWMRDAGRAPVQSWPIVYYRKHPCWLLRHGSALLSDDPSGMDDADTPGWAIERSTQPGDLVIDPCIGRGGTLVHAHRLGRVVRGSELHPRRLAVALDKLHSLGMEVRRVW